MYVALWKRNCDGVLCKQVTDAEPDLAANFAQQLVVGMRLGLDDGFASDRIDAAAEKNGYRVNTSLGWTFSCSLAAIRLSATISLAASGSFRILNTAANQPQSLIHY